MDKLEALREEYLAGGKSIAALAEKYGISPRLAYRRCGEEGWVQMRRQGKKETDPLQAAADALLARVRKLIAEGEELDVKSMRDLASILKEIRALQGKADSEEGVAVSLRQEVMDYSE